MQRIIEHLDPPIVRGVVLLDAGPFAERLRAAGRRIEVLAASSRIGLVSTLVRLRRAVAASGATVVHANGFRAAALCALACAGLRARVVWVKVDFGRDGWPANAVALGCAEVIGISEAVTQTFRPRMRRRVVVVPYGLPDYDIDPSAEHGAVRRRLDLADDDPVAVLSGRLSPGKGQLDLIESLPAVIDAVPRLKVVLLGGEDSFFPGYREVLLQRSRELGLGESLIPLGHLGDSGDPDAPVRFTAGCDVLVAPSIRQERGGWAEGFGLAVAEAMAVGTPVVAYSNGALPETIGDCGLVVPEGDRAGLSRALVRALEDSPERERLRRCGPQRIRENFRLDDSLGDFARRYLEVAARQNHT